MFSYRLQGSMMGHLSSSKLAPWNTELLDTGRADTLVLLRVEALYVFAPVSGVSALKH